MKAVWSQGQRKRRIAHLARDCPLNRRCAIFCIAESLSFFLHGDKDGGVLFTVAKSDIKFGTQPGRILGFSSIGVLKTPHLSKKVVRVINVRKNWHQQSMAASLEQEKFFADGCYHVNSFFCLCRRMGNTEAPCERWIGSWKYLYHPTQGPTPTTLCQRVRMIASG